MTHHNGAHKAHQPTPEEIEADIQRQREDLARTLTSMQAKLDLRTRARELATTDTGRPRPAVVASALGATALAGTALVARHRHSEEGMHMSKWTMLAAGGVGYVLGTRAGRERYEQIKHSAQQVADSRKARDLRHHATESFKQQAPVVKEKVGAAAHAAASKVRHHDNGGGSHKPIDDLTEGTAYDTAAHRASDPEHASEQAEQYPSAYAAARREDLGTARDTAGAPLDPSTRPWDRQS